MNMSNIPNYIFRGCSDDLPRLWIGDRWCLRRDHSVWWSDRIGGGHGLGAAWVSQSCGPTHCNALGDPVPWVHDRGEHGCRYSMDVCRDVRINGHLGRAFDADLSRGRG